MKSITRLILCGILFCLFTLRLCVSLGASTAGWAKTYGETGEGYYAASLIQTSDGGYAIAGYVENLTFGGHKHFCLLKTDSSGIMQWNKTYMGTTDDYVYSAVQTSDGGYAIAGSTNGTPSLLKTDSSGIMQWKQMYNNADIPVPYYAVVQTGDGGYALAGGGPEEFLLAKTDAAGSVEWFKTCGPELGWANSMAKTTDGGYILAGTYGSDFSLAKTDSLGNTTWYQTYGTNEDEKANSVIQTGDGGYAMAGDTGSPQSNPSSPDGYLLIKTDSSGIMQWNKTYGGITTEDFANSLIQTGDGGYAMAGVSENMTFQDAHVWLIKTDSNGNKQWDLEYAVNSGEGNSVVQTKDGGYAIAGRALYDLLLIKTDANGAIPQFPSFVPVLSFMALTTLAILVYKRRTTKTAQKIVPLSIY
jgi:hypothetical protein